MNTKIAYTILGFIAANIASCVSEEFIAKWAAPVPLPDTQPGGLDFGLCCRRFLKDAIIPEKDRITVRSEFLPMIHDFESNSPLHKNWTSKLEEADRYPCDSPLTVDWTPVPVIPVHYTWCNEQCPGWQRSLLGSLQQWIGPLVQFILPCLAFCLSIPRGWKIATPEWIFRSPPGETTGFFLYSFKLLVALIIVCVDTMSWLCVCFAFAGPMMLSALYEYMLDGKILKYLLWDSYAGQASPLLKARLLLAIVAGNILVVPDGHGMNFDLSQSDVWKDVVKVVQSDDIPSPAQTSHIDMTTQYSSRAIADEGESGVKPRNNTRYIYDENAPSRLRTLINSQASFGATVGAPIIFFVGGFTYNILEAESRQGDNDTAHALAYGMWWMIIPHLAIISCAMLAASSPSILHGLVSDESTIGTPTGPWRRRLSKVVACNPSTSANRDMRSPRHMLRTLINRVADLELLKPEFDGRFETVSLWRRGPNKRLWVNEVITWHESEARRARQRRDSRSNSTQWANIAGTPPLRELLKFGLEDRLWLLLAVLILVVVPSALAGATSWNTPRTGLSCRSLNHLAYLCAQILQMILWVWDTRLHYGSTDRLQKSACWSVQFVVGTITVFISIGGTLMQIIGVYRNCLCSIPVWDWAQRMDPSRTGIYVGLGTRTFDSKYQSRLWPWMGGAAAIVLCLVAAISWWHQRRLRRCFLDETVRLSKAMIYFRYPPELEIPSTNSPQMSTSPRQPSGPVNTPSHRHLSAPSGGDLSQSTTLSSMDSTDNERDIDQPSDIEMQSLRTNP